MAPADRKKTGTLAKTNSKSKVAAVPQKSILELLTKKKITGDDSAGAIVGGTLTNKSFVDEGVEIVADSTTLRPSIAPGTEPPPGDSSEKDGCNASLSLPVKTSKHVAGKTTSTTAANGIIDILDDDSDPQQFRAGLSVLLSESSRSISTLPIPAGPLSRPHSSDGGTRDDPIILDSSSPVKPSTTIDLTKPTYSIFAPRPKPPTRVLQSKTKWRKSDKAMETPFPDADSQHVRGPQTNVTAPPLHFERRTKAKATEVIDVDDLHPDLSSFRECISDSHSQFLGPRPIQFNQSLGRDEYINTIPNEHICSHPVITHVLQQPASSTTESSQELWADKWCPQRADHVLGNEHHALYLRDWLRALELQLEVCPESPQMPSAVKNARQNPKDGTLRAREGKGVKRQRPRVVRAVTKKKGRKKQRIDSDEDDWIINTDEETEEDEWEGHEEGSEIGDDDGNDDHEDDVEFCRKQTLSRLRRIESSPAPASSPPPLPQITHAAISPSELHNTLLLAGPPGSGKTAAVYACAKEMAWEVFEVYPGVGKRSGQCLDQLIGEVGKNHLVRKAGGARRADGAKNAFVDVLGKGKKVDENRTVEPMEITNKEESSGTGDFGFMVPLTNTSIVQRDPDADEQTDNPPPPIRGVRQSLILLEEVDILFEEDKGFWPTVVNIIKDCKRPVVMTCNDVSLIPTTDLPLQSILFFEHCPAPIAASYLQSICLAEGSLVDRSSLIDLCESTHHTNDFDTPDAPLNPLTARLPVPDLRRAIHCLQLGSSLSATSEPNKAHGVSPAEKRRTEYLENLTDWSTAQVAAVLPTTDAQEHLRVLCRLIAHTDTMSFADSHLTRMPLDTSDALAFRDFDSSPDDEMGHTHLFGLPGASIVLSSYHTDEVIYEDIIRQSRGTLEVCNTTPLTVTSTTIGRAAFQTHGLFRARVDHQSQMLDLLDLELIPLQSHLLPRPAVFLDYVPWIRTMAQIDDVLEAAGGWGTDIKPRPGRSTRNSGRTSYARQLTLTDKQREIVAKTRFNDLGVP